MKTLEYYFPDEKSGLLDEITIKLIRMGINNFSVEKLGAGNVLIILNK